MPIPNIFQCQSLTGPEYRSEPVGHLGEPYVRIRHRDRDEALATLTPDEADELAFSLLESAMHARGTAYPAALLDGDQWPVPGTVDDAEFGKGQRPGGAQS